MLSLQNETQETTATPSFFDERKFLRPTRACVNVKIPATSANVGTGFDCIGLALKLYNNISVEPIEEGLIIESKNGLSIPFNEHNLIYKTIRDFYNEAGLPMPGLKIVQDDSIPMTRGLGSSAACIVGGLLAANEMSGLGLSKDELINKAAFIEGHPDNSTPAFTGGIVVGAMADNRLDYIRIGFPKDLKLAVFIPDFELSTEKARQVVPQSFSRADAIHNTSRTALLTAALLTRDYEKLATAVDDRFHQPYRMPIVPGMDYIFEKSKEAGACAVFLSGAGPSVLAMTTKDDFCRKMQPYLNNLPNQWSLEFIEPDSEGAIIF